MFLIRKNCTIFLCYSWVSGISLLGIPTEIYVYGIQYAYISGGFLLTTIIMSRVYLPVFQGLKLTSTYEVEKLKIENVVHIKINICFSIMNEDLIKESDYLDLYCSQLECWLGYHWSYTSQHWHSIKVHKTMFHEKQSKNSISVTGVNVHLITPIVCAICIVYTSMVRNIKLLL